MEKTLAIIKPDAVSQRLTGRIIQRIEDEGFEILAMKMVWLTREAAQGFYHVHREMPFFNDLVAFMSSGPSVVMVLAKEDAIAYWREIMGATDPKEAAKGTIRRELAQDKEKNAVHGSDSPETAAFELNFFFSCLELME